MRCVSTIITKNKIIKEVAKKEGLSVATMRSIYQTLENYIFDSLSNADQNKNINLQLFNGISIESSYIKEKEVKHPKTGKIFLTGSKIWAKPKITRHYNRKLNNYF